MLPQLRITPIVAVMSLSLIGCAPAVLSSSERTVVVKGTGRQVAEVQALADEQCARHGRKARMRQMADPEKMTPYVFDCQQ